MKPVNINFSYQGKAGGIEKEKNDDVLVFQPGQNKTEKIFGRAGHTSNWQKLRNSLNLKTAAKSSDAVEFLVSRGIDERKAKNLIASIKMPNGQISARGFEMILEGKHVENRQSLLRTDWEKDAFKLKNSNQLAE